MMKRATFSAPLCATALLALVAVSFGEAQAQSAVITGKVTGRQGEALGGAIVVIDELSTAVATTTAGTYTLTVAPERTKGQTVSLRARYIGYSPSVKQVTLTPGTQSQDFELKFDPMTLDAVVVTGVAEATERKKLTFAVGNVDASQLNQVPAVSALGALEGKVAGVRLIQANGAPGGEPTIRLRGATALTSPSACSTQPCPSTDVSGPLIVVDGTISHYSLADISPQDIERVEVVKGAAASSLYGSNAANGVVQIFTKRGDRVPDGKLAVTVRNEYGQSFRPKQIPITHAHPYLTAPAAGTDPCGNNLVQGDFIDAGGCLAGADAVPSPKPDGIAVLRGGVPRAVHQPVRPEPGRDALCGVHPAPTAEHREPVVRSRQPAYQYRSHALQRVRENDLPAHRLAVVRGPLQLRLRVVQLPERDAEGLPEQLGRPHEWRPREDRQRRPGIQHGGDPHRRAELPARLVERA